MVLLPNDNRNTYYVLQTYLSGKWLFFRLTRFNGKRYHGKKNQWEWGKKKVFFFSPHIFNDFLVFINLLIRQKYSCSCSEDCNNKINIFFWVFFYGISTKYQAGFGCKTLMDLEMLFKKLYSTSQPPPPLCPVTN